MSPSALSTDLLKRYRHLSENIFTVIDVETTGNRPPDSRVIELSILHASLQNGILDQQTYLINPGQVVPRAIAKLTGITTHLLSTAPMPEEVWPHCLAALNSHILTAHNLAFDYRFVQAEYQQLNVEFQRPVELQLCTVQLARLMLPDLPSRSLPDLVNHFKFDVLRSHRATEDTLACWLLLQHLLTKIQQESDATLLKQFGDQWLTLKDAAAILGCSSRKARTKLAKIEPRISNRRKALLYRRRDVEAVLWQQGRQLSLF